LTYSQPKNNEDRSFLQKKFHIRTEQTFFFIFMKKNNFFNHTRSLDSVSREVTLNFIIFFQKSPVFAGIKLTYLQNKDMDIKKNVSATIWYQFHLNGLKNKGDIGQ